MVCLSHTKTRSAMLQQFCSKNTMSLRSLLQTFCFLSAITCWRPAALLHSAEGAKFNTRFVLIMLEKMGQNTSQNVTVVET